MRPLDPRLLRYARSTRAFLALAVVLGAVTAVLVIVQARLLSSAIVRVTADGTGLAGVEKLLQGLAAVVVLRAVVSWVSEAAAYRSSAQAKQELREAALEHAMRTGQTSGELAALLTRGVDALDAYYSRYLPQLVLAVVVPVAVLATVLGQDLLSAVVIAVTLPLIPVFMVLIGLYTRARVDRQWRTLAVLSGHFLDLVAGLPTLKVLGRATAQVEAIRAIGDRYRSTTMGVLRVSFLSSLVLELLASLSVALVAVSVGLRLAEGQMAYGPALFILILAPEAYLPLRLVGQHFHAAAEGLGAAERLFEVLETPLPLTGTQDVPQRPTLVLDGVGVTYPGRDTPALHPTTVTVPPGSVVALVGPSGGGKSTLLAVLLGFVAPTTGRVAMRGDGVDGDRVDADRVDADRVDGDGWTDVDIVDADPDRWRSRIAWVPQDPHLVAPASGDRPTVADAVRLGRPEAADAEVLAAMEDAGLGTEVPLDAVLGEDGAGVSAGQRRRLALARALLTDAPVLLLDEPTAALDGVSEAAVVAAVARAAAAGRTVVVVAHRPALVRLADQVVHVAAPRDRTGPVEGRAWDPGSASTAGPPAATARNRAGSAGAQITGSGW